MILNDIINRESKVSFQFKAKRPITPPIIPKRLLIKTIMFLSAIPEMVFASARKFSTNVNAPFSLILFVFSRIIFFRPAETIL